MAKLLTSTGNRFLERLPKPVRDRLIVSMEPAELAFEQVLYESHRAMLYAYFPKSSVLSALVMMENGTAIEAATIGNEGLVGHTAALGAKLSVNKVIVQVADGGWRIEIDTLRVEILSS